MIPNISLADLLNCDDSKEDVRVRSRERSNLEFKADSSKSALSKCVKSIAAFANCGGGNIVFGVTDSPRKLCGCSSFPDEADLQNLLTKHLYPVPEIEVSDHELFGFQLHCISVAPAIRPPVIAIKDLQTPHPKNSTVLSQGVVYFRRAGQSRPATGEEFGSLLDRRDEIIRQSILSFLAQGKAIGFENVAVADFRKYGSRDENVTLWVPEAVAKDLRIVDRARLVESDGAPAYQIRGNVSLTVPSDKDPRKPLFPKPAARALSEFMKEKFWPEFPWGETHLRKACEHLGHWAKKEGDGKNTGWEPLSKRPLYYDAGRQAVRGLATKTPDEFVEVVGSKATKDEWLRRSGDLFLKVGASQIFD